MSTTSGKSGKKEKSRKTTVPPTESLEHGTSPARRRNAATDKQGHAASPRNLTDISVRTDGAELDDDVERLVTETLLRLSNRLEERSAASMNSPTRSNRADSPDPDDHSEAAAQQKLDNYLTGFYYGMTEGEQRLVVYRCLKAEKFNIDNAVQALMSTIEFRKRQNLNRMVLFPSLIATRGYNERLVCQTLQLPFLEDWQLTAAGVVPSMSTLSGSQSVGLGDDPLQLSRPIDVDTYYQVSYSDYLVDTDPSSPVDLLHVVSTPVHSTSNQPFRSRSPRGNGAVGSLSSGCGPIASETSPTCSMQLRTPASAHSLAPVDSREYQLTPPHIPVGAPHEDGHHNKDNRDAAHIDTALNGPSGDTSNDASATDATPPENHSATSLRSAESVLHASASTSGNNKGLFGRLLGHLNPFGRADCAPNEEGDDTLAHREEPQAPPPVSPPLPSWTAPGSHPEANPSPAKHTDPNHHTFLGNFFGRAEGKEGSGTSAAHAVAGAPSPAANSKVSGDHHNPRGPPEAAHSGPVLDPHVSDSVQLVDRQTSIFVNADGAARALPAGPLTRYSEALDFHALLQPIVNAVVKYLPTCIHYWDRQGRPVMYIKLGEMRAKKLVEGLFKLTPVSTEPKALALLYHAYSLEVMAQLIRFNNRKNKRDNEIRAALLAGQPLLGGHASPLLRDRTILPAKTPTNACVVVIDCAKVRFEKLLYKPLLQIVKPLITLDQKHYSELLHHLYVVNCNSAVNFSYLTIRGVLCEETRAKISFCTRRTTTDSLKVAIDEDLLPSEYGGRCQCPGGCVPLYKSPSDTSSVSSSLSLTESRGADGDIMSESFEMSTTLDSTMVGVRQKLNCTVEKMVVAPRKKSTLCFPVVAHEEVFWEFRCRNQRSVEFSVVYIPLSEDGAMFSLSDPARVKDGASHYICPHPGSIIMEWSNKFSKLHKINIHAKIYREGSASDCELSPRSISESTQGLR